MEVKKPIARDRRDAARAVNLVLERGKATAALTSLTIGSAALKLLKIFDIIIL